MRWRMSLFFLAVTAAFCFLLLTAVTDYGAPGHHPLLSAGRDGQARLLSMTVLPPDREPRVERKLLPDKFDPTLRPQTPALFVPHNADPVYERAEREKALEDARERIPAVRRVVFDGKGWHRVEQALVTAYCPCEKCCGTQSPGITSTGKSAWKRGLAADPIYLHYGTQVYIPGYGMAEIDDTGGAMRRHWRRDGMLHIDVRMTYHYEARKWGKRYLPVKIYEIN